MRQILASNNKGGFTLIEVMVSLAIISIVFLGLTDTSIVALDFNLNNQIREEAVQVADSAMDLARNTPFDNLVAATTTGTISRSVRGKVVPYAWTRLVEDLDGNNRNITITVNWPSRSYRNGRWVSATKSHSIVSVINSGTGMR